MAEDFALNVDFAVLRHGKEKSLLAWGDPVRVVGKHADRFDVEVVTWVRQPDKSLKPVISTGTLKRKLRVDGVDREVALPADQVRVLKLSFVDVQQGDGTLIQTPEGRVITLDGGENQLFARFLASRFRDTAADKRLEIDAMVVTHGDADHFSGLTEIFDTETDDLPDYKRIFVHPKRVYHNGLVKRPKGVPLLDSFGATQTPPGEDPVVTALETDLTTVPAASMNAPFKAWRKALIEWSKAGTIDFRRLAKGDTTAFDFLANEKIKVEVLGPIETPVNGAPGLRFLRGPKDGVPLDHIDFQPGSLSASHTVNGHSIVLRLKFGKVRMLFSGDLNNASERVLIDEHKTKRTLRAEVFKAPHHGSHEFEPAFLKAVSPVISIVSSGDENAQKEHIHPRATLLNALGRFSRDDTGLVFVTELVAFFRKVGPAVTAPKPPATGTPFFGFERTAFGCVRVRTDGEHVLVFTDSGERDIKEAYAYDATSLGVMKAVELRRE